VEQRRLSRLNELLNQACLRELRLQRGQRVLDVGSGLGQFTRDIARTVGSKGRVLGIERDPEQLAEAQRQAELAGEPDSVEWRQGDAAKFPLTVRDWGSFDIAHTRFVLEHVSRPEQIVRQMVRSVRAGGRVVLADDDHQILRLWPEPEGFVALWQGYIQTYEHLGCDPFVGRRLVALLQKAGATPMRNDWIFFGSCAGAPDFPGFIQNLIGVIETAREVMTGPLKFGARDFDRALRNIRSWSRRADAAIWYGLCWAEGVRS